MPKADDAASAALSGPSGGRHGPQTLADILSAHTGLPREEIAPETFLIEPGDC